MSLAHKCTCVFLGVHPRAHTCRQCHCFRVVLEVGASSSRCTKLYLTACVQGSSAHESTGDKEACPGGEVAQVEEKGRFAPWKEPLLAETFDALEASGGSSKACGGTGSVQTGDGGATRGSPGLLGAAAEF